jgi:hypothetical protein
MDFRIDEQVQAPVGVVFAALTRFQRFERDAAEHGIGVRRGGPANPGVGTTWDAEFEARGKLRQLQARITEFHPPQGLVIEGTVGGMAGTLRVVLSPLGPDLTGMQVEMTVAARSLSARMMLASLALAKGRVAKRLRKMVRKFARRTEKGQPAYA